MKIVDLQVIPFHVPRRPFHNGELLPETQVVQTLTRVVTDEGAEGYYLGGHGHGDHDGLTPGERALLEGHIRSLVLGQDPFDRERFWHWMWTVNLPENVLSVLDMVLWDLQGRAFGVPVHKLLGGRRKSTPTTQRLAKRKASRPTRSTPTTSGIPPPASQTPAAPRMSSGTSASAAP
jgi:L-alanine-DL-glutamate epimerase-like enolase superfamily enzyme